MHKSVLLNESVTSLNLKEDSIIVDCTLGYAGHSSLILKEIPKGYLYGFDQDINAVNYSREILNQISSNFEIIKSNFVNLKSELELRGTNQVDGILFDLGVSSPQLDNQNRGFSFHQDHRLDMRMDQDQLLSAYEVVNNYSYEELLKIFYKYGEEKYASGIAKQIINHRNEKPIESTMELVEIIKKGVPEKYKREKHPARKVFQAIRIEVNNELEVFETALKDALELIKLGGRVAVITFHSLEDKICKDVFKKVSTVNKELKNLPIIPDQFLPKYKVVEVLKPSKEELLNNNRARSARLRVIERIKE